MIVNTLLLNYPIQIEFNYSSCSWTMLRQKKTHYIVNCCSCITNDYFDDHHWHLPTLTHWDQGDDISPNSLLVFHRDKTKINGRLIRSKRMPNSILQCQLSFFFFHQVDKHFFPGYSFYMICSLPASFACSLFLQLVQLDKRQRKKNGEQTNVCKWERDSHTHTRAFNLIGLFFTFYIYTHTQ